MFGQVRWYLKRWVGDDSQANDLLTGISGLKTAEANIALWRIARRARREPAVRTIVEQSEPDELLERLQSTAATKSTAEELHAYLDEFGHRAADELEARTPRWVEQPGALMAAFRGYVLAANELDPEGFEERQRQKRLATEEEVRRKLSGGWPGKLFPWRWWLFRTTLREAQNFMPMRENPKFHLLKLSLHSRRALMELARRWKASGFLGDEDDIFFLRGEEVLRFARLPEAGRAEPAEQIKQLIAKRRSEFSRYEVMDPPMVLTPGDLDRAEPPRETSDGYVDGALLKGIPASAGVATGRARVILHPGDATLEAGEILVAPFTDPGWTPFFPLAAAVVMDLGGMLSHGAVVAREYGIPAVVNTRVATSQIKTGQMVSVDGRAGTVTLIAE
jgi:rifampicin phosphotransferase